MATTLKRNRTIRPSAEVRAAEAARKQYSPETKSIARRAEKLRGRPRTVGPIQVLRVQNALGKRDPIDVLGMVPAKAKAYASGSKDVEASAGVKALSALMADPYCRGRGLAAILLALAGK